MERLFNLDPQLIHDTVLLAAAVFVMFTLLSYLLFNPARELLRKRREGISSEIDAAKKDRQEAAALKEEYDGRIRKIEREAEQILSDARRKALKNEEKILEEARQEAARMIARADAQIELDRRKAADEMKREMIQIASLMARKAVAGAVDRKLQESLLEETLKEIGDQTWQN